MGRLGLTDVTQTAAQTGAAIATANASDQSTSNTLLNAEKVELNKTITDVATLVVDMTSTIKEINACRLLIQNRVLADVGLTLITQTAAQTASAVATANASDLTTSKTLAAALLVDYNKTITDVGTVVTDITESITQVNAMIGILEDQILGNTGLAEITQTAAQTGAAVTDTGTADLAAVIVLANAIKVDYNKTITDVGTTVVDIAAMIVQVNHVIEEIQDKLL